MRRGELRGNPESVKTLLEMHANGCTNVMISRSLNCTAGAVRAYLISQDLPSNPRIYPSVEMVDANHAKCSKCREVKPIEEWSKKFKPCGLPKLTYCGLCYDAQQVKAFNSGPLKQIQRRLIGVRFRCRRDGIDYDLDEEYMLWVWQKQAGRCFYTDTPLGLSYGTGRSQSNGPSIDRIRPEIGYTKGDTVIASVRANTIKHDMTLEELREWMPGWYSRINRLLMEESNG